MKHMWSEEEINKAPKVLESLVDSKGNPRFVEGEAEIPNDLIEGINITYNKWSLSGTHLMLVLGGNIENATGVPSSTIFGVYKLPNYILQKITPVWLQFVDVKTISLRADDWTTQTLNFVLRVNNDNIDIITTGGTTLTLTANRTFRLQFDLLIDTE